MWYATRTQLKNALGINASSTGKHTLLDMVLEDVAQQFDRYVGFSFGPTSGTRFYTPYGTDCLDVDYPLLAVDSVQISSDGGSTYGTTMATGSYYLTPYNATMESPARPFWGLELKESCATAVFPKDVQRGARVTGTWGYFDERDNTSVTLATGANATAERLEFANASALHVGQTVLIDSERMQVVRSGHNGSDTATTSGSVHMKRGVDGTNATSHTSGAAVQVYRYPTVETAAVWQAEQDFRAFDAPLGFVGGEPFGVQQIRPTGGAGLHPFTMRALDRFRTPVAI